MVTGATSLIGDTDLHLFNEGSHLRLWEKLGAHPGTSGARAGTHFAVWAPGAERVSVIGDWNGWNREAAPLAPRGDSGIWEGFVPGVERGARYKYHVASRNPTPLSSQRFSSHLVLRAPRQCRNEKSHPLSPGDIHPFAGSTQLRC